MKININEIVGQKFGKWTIVSADRNSSHVVECETVCECGVKGKQDYVELKLGRSTKCRQCVIKEKQEENDKQFIGQTFGSFTVLSFSRTDKHSKRLYNVRCKCGLEREMNGSVIKRGVVKTCQTCFEQQNHPRFKDLTNQRFGKLVAIKTVGKNNHGNYLWETKCDCQILSVKNSADLTSGNTKTCGQCEPCGTPHDLTDRVFGMLKVLGKGPNLSSDKTSHIVQCSCRSEPKAVKTASLLNGSTESCGCQINYNKVNLIGRVFDRLTVVDQLDVKGSHKTYLCECVCGEICEVSGGNLTSEQTKSCGCLRDELMSAMAKKQVGPNNPGWKGGGKYYNPLRSCMKYVNWRNAVLERDGSFCQICTSETRPEAHHLDSFKDNIDQIYDLENGICLCHEHHKQFHKVWGYGENTPDQFHQFKQDVLANNI